MHSQSLGGSTVLPTIPWTCWLGLASSRWVIIVQSDSSVLYT